MLEKIRKFIFKKLFIVSKQPVLFKDLLEANCLFNEGMLVDPSKLNFRFRDGRLYTIYGILCFIILAAAIIILHKIFEKIDFHYSIIGTMIMTALVFIGFDFFKVWARKSISHELIKKAWDIHFPYFPYEKYSQKIEIIYNEAIKKEIPRKDLEKYVLDQLVLRVSSDK
ncbi:hypothetical protein [Campylobacter fetus]|uniref:hypothetical protein n=1 Tax=Campylobacter fetus TaxID=196 RepID=UPI000FCAE1FC|nr:hypothetical protein [Campylobacter fetus]QQF51417.1 hypothetical protein HHI31_00645 [Campylobacter fetus subsp. venerealis]RUT49070.1 hypothetical protein BWK67_08455 [Campylobacter fetus]RUT49234.1 hypothetical protein BWK51_08430 [Campylobacter fetus]